MPALRMQIPRILTQGVRGLVPATPLSQPITQYEHPFLQRFLFLSLSRLTPPPPTPPLLAQPSYMVRLSSDRVRQVSQLGSEKVRVSSSEHRHGRVTAPWPVNSVL